MTRTQKKKHRNNSSPCTDSDEISPRRRMVTPNEELMWKKKALKKRGVEYQKKSNITTHALCTDSNDEILPGRRMVTPNKELM
ncbi:24983_t:CDS:2 [Gigaspora margarita]|uniref:24983_t:CDS:1 n=1 Tax=Gigaspora margarita TaxID=4874 RepID=A0ABN7WT29_GIGMA|nr:24983_t:CDS:2 [Gigaspora margarita]